MPGLSQIKKFSSDLLSIGDEVTLRASRGEKPVSVEIPKSVEDKNDSEDFVLGMPEIESEAPVELDEDLSDLSGLASPAPSANSEATDAAPAFAAPDLSSLLNPINVPDDASAGADMPDLSMFEDQPVEEEIQEEEEPEEISVGDMDLDALLAGGGFDQPEEEEPEPEEEKEPVDMSATEEVGGLDELDAILGNTAEQSSQMPDEPAAEEMPLEPAEDVLNAPAEAAAEPGEDFNLDNLDLDNLSAPEGEVASEEQADGLHDLDELGDLDALGSEDGLDNLSGGLDDLSADGLDNLSSETADAAGLDDLSADGLEAPETEDFGSESDNLSGGLDDFSTDGLDDSGLDMPAADSDSAEGGLDNLTEDKTTSDDGQFDLSDLGDFNFSDENTSENPEAAAGGLDDFSTDGLDNLSSETGDAAGLDDLSAGGLEAPETEDFGSGSDNLSGGLDDFSTDGLDDSGLDMPAADSDSAEGGLDNLTNDNAAAGGDFDFNLGDPDAFNSEEDKSEGEAGGEETPAADTDDLSSGENAAAPEGLFNMDDIDLPDMDNVSSDSAFSLDDDVGAEKSEGEDNLSGDSENGGNDSAENFGIDDNFGLDEASADGFEQAEEGPAETYDVSDMEGLDFGIQETDSQMKGDTGFNLGNDDDFAMDSDFEIPGFSDVETAKDEKKSATPLVNGKDKKSKKNKKKNDVDEVDFSDALESEELPPNTLSDAQYKTFLQNLSEYPLNVRLAIENLIVQDEFTDDAEFEVIEKVLNKAPARSVASMLEKMLDTSIPVPRDFEHRTAEEYEAYKKSLSYQLKNRIIPALLVGIVALLLAWGLYNFGKNCIYKPLKAVSLYKQGYNLLEKNEYPQSELKFNQATKYRLNKPWFFKYARGYREHKQYQRAETMYENILYCFKHDKAAGLEYADMELNDLANYEKAEEIVRRQVLDYHVNDADGILKLGDIYLEWGTEKDPSKLEEARAQYATLIQLYKANDLYLSRMMRYFIRTDNLRQVLQLKPNFEKREKSLGWEDWTELSGYLLDKAYGTLSPSEEYLRYQIEGLRGLLLQAVKSNPDNPIAQYNIGRYFIISNETGLIENALQKAIKNFNNAASLKTRDIYKYIDSYRLLGEFYTDKEEYLQAQEQYAEGINLYTTERDNAGFEGNQDIGKLYADLGDIKYFVSGDYDDALLNYESSVALENDNPSIRYRIGYIQYEKDNYLEALGSFMKAGEGNIKEKNLMLSMANTLAIRGDDYAAQGYYENLINRLDEEVEEKGMVFPQASEKDNDLVTQYMYASNNYGVTLYKLARRTGNSNLNAQSIVQFQQSVRAWDALTRNQQTMVRLGGSNLAEENIKYVTHPMSDFEPSIYLDIPKTLDDKEHI